MDHTREFKLEDGRTLYADPRSCFFCDHLTDIWYDSEGPYMFLCELDNEIETGMYGNCEDFTEEEDGDS